MGETLDVYKLQIVLFARFHDKIAMQLSVIEITTSSSRVWVLRINLTTFLCFLCFTHEILFIVIDFSLSAAHFAVGKIIKRRCLAVWSGRPIACASA